MCRYDCFTQFDRITTQVNILKKALKQSEEKEAGGYMSESEKEMEARITEIRKLREYISNMQLSYESTVIRLRKVVEEGNTKLEKIEDTSRDLRKQVALLQVSEKNLSETIDRLRQKNRQYFEISMMQLEELGSYKQRYKLFIQNGGTEGCHCTA